VEPMNRRAFIARSGAAAAALGAAVLVPSQFVSATTRSPEAPSTPGAEPLVAPGGAEFATMPIIAHVRDIATGEIALFYGERETTLHDRALALGLARAAGGK
jgi:hypothetical protein